MDASAREERAVLANGCARRRIGIFRASVIGERRCRSGNARNAGIPKSSAVLMSWINFPAARRISIGRCDMGNRRTLFSRSSIPETSIAILPRWEKIRCCNGREALKTTKIDMIFASDLERTKESAEIIAKELGYEDCISISACVR